ncbi:DUF2846 domain-containing protein [Acinetobacter sp. WZC-1]|uniref:DUF2846 domain-containing protein n=1 Tax=Acinetobacter sp. WZC-1 TaxID=3459034 RepID=UPI00403E1AD6
MLKHLFISATLSSLMIGCATVPTSTPEITRQVQQLNAPSAGQAGIYIYRNSNPVAGMVKRDIWIDGKCVGESARGVFFHQEVEGGKEHLLATESEFSPNTLKLRTEAGKNYFVQQLMKPGFVVSGAKLRQVDETKGTAAIRSLKMAENGTCSGQFKP